ncbi:MAG: DUF5667 domain-containing protein [bacterium]
MGNNNDVIKELQKLKSIRPDDVFVCKTKEKLLILMGKSKVEEQKIVELVKFGNIWYDNLSKLFYRLAKPVGVFLLILSVLAGGSVGVSFASYNSVPGDIFYDVKLTIEKAQISLKSKEEDKVKLEVEFAGRRIEEFNKVKANEIFKNKKEPKNTKIALDNFKKNIETVQQRLEKIKEQDFTKETIEIVSLVEEKTVEYALALKNISNEELESKKKEEANNALVENDDKVNKETIKNEGIKEKKDDDGAQGLDDNSDISNNPISTIVTSAEEVIIDDKMNATSTDVIAATSTEIVVENNGEVAEENGDGIDKALKEALEISENLGIKAVDIILEKQNNGGISLSQDDIAKKVKNKADNIKNELDGIKVDLAKDNNGTSTIDAILKEKTEEDEEYGDGKDKEVIENKEKEQAKQNNTAEDINKIDTALGEIDELINNGYLTTAFDKVKEANELKKNVENKIEKVKEKSSLEKAEIKENSIEHEK